MMSQGRSPGEGRKRRKGKAVKGADKELQQSHLQVVLYAGAGLVAFGTVLDSLSNAMSIVTPRVSYVGSVVVGVLALSMIVRAKRLRERPASNVVPAWGAREYWALAGILFLLWVPRWLPGLLGPNESSVVGDPAAIMGRMDGTSTGSYPSDLPRPTKALEWGYASTLNGFDYSYNNHLWFQRSAAIPDWKVNYYLVSDEDFLKNLFEGSSEGYDADVDPTDVEGKSTADTEEAARMMEAVIVPSGAPKLETEPFRFGLHLWQTYLREKSAIKSSDSSAAISPLFKASNSRIRSDVGEYRSIAWFDLTNAELSAGGWLKMDPLTAELVKHNPAAKDPFAKAGAIRWRTDEFACGDDGEEPPTVKEETFLIPRWTKFLFADIVNVSGRRLDNISINLKQWIPEEPLTALEAGALNERLSKAKVQVVRLPQVSLEPDQRVIVPFGLMLGEYRDAVSYEPGKRLTNLFIGPYLRIESLDYIVGEEKKTAAVRQFNADTVNYLKFGWGGACCPFVYVRSNSHSAWLRQGPVLVGADSARKERVERRTIPVFDGTIRLSEEEAETSYVNFVAIEAFDGHTWRTLRSNLKKLRKVDQSYLELRRGEKVDVRFPAWSAKYVTARLVVGGYYVPTSRDR